MISEKGSRSCLVQKHQANPLKRQFWNLSQLMQQSFLPISKIVEKPYSTILGYPRFTKRQLTSRINELKKLQIKSISFQGNTKIGKVSVLGKGYTSIVVLAKMRNKLVSIKIRRTDSPRTRMKEEVNLLKIANKVGVGPKFIGNSKNFLVMEYLDGDDIGQWVKQLKKSDTKKIRLVMKKILEDCYCLDRIYLDHGELSSIKEHVIIGKTKITLIDFESASTVRRVSNVTSSTQAICIGSGISKSLRKIYSLPTKKKIIKILRDYKHDQTRTNFDKLLQVLVL